MNSQRAVYYVCHTLSQLTRKSFFLSLSLKKKNSNDFLEGWSLKEWVEFCTDLQKESDFSLLLQKCSISLNQLTQIIYNSIQISLEGSGKLIILGDKDYPRNLREITDRPLCLFCKGNTSLLNTELIAIIGSRKASHEALEKSFELSSFLTETGRTVVSGGAYGCDVLAHKGALKTGKASTIVVFSGGLGNLYPKGNEKTFREILEKNGLLITERLWGQSSKPYDFPIRNRIISGLCSATLVMDAGVKSGSMVTAHKALDQGRSVFVLKPPKNNLRSEGIRLLMEEGADTFSKAEELSHLLLRV